ncbi:MAG TPA: RidA family protein [Natronosporangium sp.]
MPTIQPIDPAELPNTGPSSCHGTAVTGARRLVFVSGQPPWSRDEPLPADFESQCRLAWRNVERVLTTAGRSRRSRPASPAPPDPAAPPAPVAARLGAGAERRGRACDP